MSESDLPSASFLNYPPVALAFGTSGLRGLVRDITDVETYINVKGALAYLFKVGDTRKGSSVVLAGDLRPSTDRIMVACVQAILDSGCTVENAGKIPTPALILHAIETKRAGVMVSGSHIPFDRNGIKLNKSVGEVLKTDEPGIAAEVLRVRAEEYGKSASESAFDASGMLRRPPALPPLERAAEERYVARYPRAFGQSGLTGKRILVYQHSAVGRDILPRILRGLGAEVVTGGRSDAFIPIDTENVTDAELDRLEELLVEASRDGRSVDAIVSTDGDSDRPLVVAVLPRGTKGRRVRFLPGDLLGLIAAEYLHADAGAVPISANDAIDQRMAESGTVLVKTRIGSPYVVAAIDELRQGGRSTRVVGWEANGGFLVASSLSLASGILLALPTRDSTLPIVANLYAAIEGNLTLSALWDRLPSRFGRAGLIDDFPVAASRAIIAAFAAAGGGVDVDFSVRKAAPAWEERRALLGRFFTRADGFGVVRRINVLDGVRVWFEGGDVAHVRPSGNAPQLRIYANADTQARADAIVECGLREPDGILRRLQREASTLAAATAVP